jgi:hypothetical protein
MNLGFEGEAADRGFCSGRNGRTAVGSDPMAEGSSEQLGFFWPRWGTAFPA